jgi:hypothetical protein
MLEQEARQERNERATRQEQDLVRMERAKGHLAWRIAREYDVQVIKKDGTILLVDSKFSDNGIFWVDSKDIIKGLDIAAKMRMMLKVPVNFCIDMWFPRTRQLNNRRYIDVSEEDRGWSIKAWKTSKKIMTERVKR